MGLTKLSFFSGNKAEAARILELEAKVAAISRSQAVIEFKLDGTILDANENFLNTLGYAASEVVGRHHSMFLDDSQKNSPDYRAFWDRLNRGEFVAEKFRRIAKGGREIYIQASYNPLLDASGKAFKVVKFATDVTAAEHERLAALAAADQKDVVEALAAALRRLADGDLSARLNEVFPGDYEVVRGDFNDAVAKLDAALSSVVESVEGIRSGSSEITHAADDLSRRTEQQAASLEETAAALDEITATVKKTAEGATHARQVVTVAKQDAETGGAVVAKAVAAMTEIQASSQKVSQIIGVIDEIAFQTNLLALNAGVEAARAGDAGKGFAVVASEVRALAQRSAEAAKEIKALIHASTNQVKTGVDLVGETGKALSRIVDQVAQINGVMSEIAASSQEQATGLQEVNTAVNQMDQATQQNAAMVEESTAASHSLAREADTLNGLMSQFTLGVARPSAATAAPRGRAPAPAVRAAREGVHRPVASPVHAAQARISRATGGGAAAATKADAWEEF